MLGKIEDRIKNVSLDTYFDPHHRLPKGDRHGRFGDSHPQGLKLYPSCW